MDIVNNSYCLIYIVSFIHQLIFIEYILCAKRYARQQQQQKDKSFDPRGAYILMWTSKIYKTPNDDTGYKEEYSCRDGVRGGPEFQ